MILSGRTVTNSLPLFNTDRLGKLLDKLASHYDVVLVDAPPVGTIIDAAKISTLCDGTLFVVQAGADSVTELKEASYQIEKSGKPILGYVMNKFDEKKHGGRYFSRKPNYYQYGKQKKSPKRFIRFQK
jgi:Mrp family chromosome partitioning ATPase